MRSVKLLILLLFIVVSTTLSANNRIVLQAKTEHSSWINASIELKVEITSAVSASSSFTEIHQVICDQEGFFSVVLGTGVLVEGDFDSLDWADETITSRILVRPNSASEWQEVGESSITPQPYAVATYRALSYTLSVPLIWAVNNVQDSTLFYFNRFPRVGIFTSTPVFDVTLKPNKQLWLSSDDPNGTYNGLINFHWTPTLGSKPAVVGYDENLRTRFAVVAHYWSLSSNRVHQHISFEVDSDTLSALNTVFPISWGHKMAYVPIQSNSVLIDNSCTFTVYEPLDKSPVLLHTNCYQTGNLWVGDTLVAPLIRETKGTLYSLKNPVTLYIAQLDDSYSARFQLANNKSKWLFAMPRSKELQLNYTDTSTPLMRFSQEGFVQFGKSKPITKLGVQGNMIAHQLSAFAEAFSIALQSKEEVFAGDIVGIEGSSLTIRKYREGDHLLGVVVDEGIVAQHTTNSIRLAVMGIVKIDQSQYFLNNGVAYTLDGQKIGLALTHNNIYINFSQN